MFTRYFIIFVISLFCITLELFLTRILNLKAWNHVVYIVIPFSILGYGIGANLYLIFKQKLDHFQENYVLGISTMALALVCILSSITLIYIPIHVEYLTTLFSGITSILKLLICYTIFMIPFIFVGFIVVYLFSVHKSKSPKLYFFDLIGAGLGAFLFFPMIHRWAVITSILLMSFILFVIGFMLLLPKKKFPAIIGLALYLGLCLSFIPEPKNYVIDEAKGWEFIPGHFPEFTYIERVSRWHPLGRTNIYEIINPQVAEFISNTNPGTFQINLKPYPNFSYVATNFLAGTPIFDFRPETLEKNDIKVDLFSQSMEVPYTILEKPKVVVIGAGGGRDIFMAKTHGASEIIGAEINPGIFKEMSLGGEFYEYSNKIYAAPNVSTYCIDGRHLVKKLKENYYDLIILNGVDTFSGLSSGAYSYAESYLYTQEALEDYLKILTPDGMINFNRWFFRDQPRETLKLFAIALAALEKMGAENPEDHIIIGENGWSLNLIKKTPFTEDERNTILDYLKSHASTPIYPFSPSEDLENNIFHQYVSYFNKDKEGLFAYLYPYDISVVHDDNPFFYKYYKLSHFNPFKARPHHHTGQIIFLTQALILTQALVFILLFIWIPLRLLNRKGIKILPNKAHKPFVLYFSCLGLGFMLIEIPLMQKFVLLLGSPIHAISVILSIILISSGLGSLSVPKLNKWFHSYARCIKVAAILVAAYLTIIFSVGSNFLDAFMGYSFFIRCLFVTIFILPLGFLLGIFFPIGLMTIQKEYEEAIPWAWGINCGFSVLGSILAIILSQYLGFNGVLQLALCTYLLGMIAYLRLARSI